MKDLISYLPRIFITLGLRSPTPTPTRRPEMVSYSILRQARAIVLECLYDELLETLSGHGIPLARVDPLVLQFFARAKLDAHRYSPRFERRD
jgi:hypothetical protein